MSRHATEPDRFQGQELVEIFASGGEAGKCWRLGHGPNVGGATRICEGIALRQVGGTRRESTLSGSYGKPEGHTCLYGRLVRFTTPPSAFMSLRKVLEVLSGTFVRLDPNFWEGPRLMR
jgi:hypothetical protein